MFLIAGSVSGCVGAAVDDGWLCLVRWRRRWSGAAIWWNDQFVGKVLR